MELNKYLKHPINYYRKWAYKNTTLLVLSLLVFLYFAESDWLKNFIAGIGELGYLGAFIAGIFFAFTFTIAPAAVVLFNIADILNPLVVALIAGAGGVIGDYIILHFLRYKIFDELLPLFKQFGGTYISNLFKTPYFVWLTPFVGAILVASPLPDELGVGLLGLSKLKDWQFITLAFLLDALGIFIIVTVARSF